MLSGFFMKKFSHVLVPVLTQLFNKAITTGRVPEIWKTAKITPVHKKGSESEIQNYRPVSNLLTIAKIFELCILQRLEKLDQDYLLGINQHGFRRNHSTDTAFASVVSAVSDIRDRKGIAVVYSVDLTAAFDMLRKEILFSILKKKGVPNYLAVIIHDYLSDRTGYVQIEDKVSCVRDIKAGCIQGSILGPFLFNVYMSDLVDTLTEATLISYADDSYVIIEGSSENELNEKLTRTINLHFNWLNNAGMICNMSKTELIVFGLDNFSITIQGVEITAGKEIKILGSYLDSKLSWEKNTNNIISKCRSLVFGLRYLRRILSLEDAVKVFKSHLISRLTYASPVWSQLLNYSMRAKLRSFYFYVIRILTRDFEFKMNRSKLLRRCSLESIDDILFKRTSTFIFKLTYHLEPTVLVGNLLSKAYVNERFPGRMAFFDTSSSRVGRSCITNVAKNITENWNFDWVGLSIYSFKKQLHLQLNPISD